MHLRAIAVASLTLLGMVLTTGCANSPKPDTTATDALGQQAIWVLQNPSKIEGWNFRGPHGAVYNDPAVRPLDLSIATELRDILFDDSTYAKIGSGGGFVRDVGFRVWRGDQSIDVLLSLSADVMIVKSPVYGGQAMTTLSADVSNARKRLERLAKKAFPDFR